MNNHYAIILAAGKGTRMKSKQYKVLHHVANKAMVEHVVDNVQKAGFDEIITVVGHGAKEVEQIIGNRSDFVLQEEQLGTGHAVLQVKEHLANKEGVTLVICGDTPLITVSTLNNLVHVHETTQTKATVLTAFAEEPFGYGRIVRNKAGYVEQIVEEKDASDKERLIQEVNTGTYVFDNRTLFEALLEVGNNNEQGEYYLPDVIGIIQNRGGKISAYQMADFDEALGVNDRVALAKANQIFYRRNNQYWMREGVTIVDPDTVYIDPDVVIGKDTIIEPQVRLKGSTHIGENCHIHSFSEIRDSRIADEVTIISSCLEEASVESHCSIGPMAHLRPKAKLGQHVHIGNFVEVKNATLGDHTKAGHLSYIGDAQLGRFINISCGVIFCNYDGINKKRSTIEDYSFIGSNSNIVAPVEIADHSFIAAGSTINRSVPSQALAVARARQENKENYWNKLPISDVFPIE